MTFGWKVCGHLIVAALLVANVFSSLPSFAQQDEIAALNAKIAELHRAGKYAEAIPLAHRALAIYEKALGPNHSDLAPGLNNLAFLYSKQGRYADAEPLYQRSLAIREKALGPNHPNVALVLNNLATLYERQGRYAGAEPLYKRSLAVREKALGANHPDVAQSLNNLAGLYVGQGRYADAEPLYKRSLAIDEKSQGPDHPDVATGLNNLASLYSDQGRYADAEPLFKRSLAIREKALGPNHPDVAGSLNNLAFLYSNQGRHADAEPLFKRSLAIWEKALGADHPNVAAALNNLALLYDTQGRYADAEPLFKRSLAINEKVLGPSHPEIAHALNNLARLYKKQGRHADAEPLFKRSLAIKEKAVGPSHPDVALILNNLAILYDASGDSEHALAFSRRATAAIVAHAAGEAPGAARRETAGGLIEQRANYFRRHVASLAVAADKGIEPAPALGREALEVAQWATHSSAAAALQQMAARFASGGGALATLVRENQDLAAAWREKDKKLLDALSKPEGQQDRAAIELLRKEIAAIESRLAALAARLEKEFPDYAALASPKPLKVAEVQKLLGADEALVYWLTGDKESFVFALTREGFEWKTIPIGAKALEDKVTAFRRGLDVDALTKAIEAATKPELFDLGTAHELYATLVSPVEALIKDKRHLLVVPSGALTAVPFQLLVTEKPAVAVPEFKTLNDLASYRDAAWLLKRHAITVLPSVASLKALRSFARTGASTKPMIGFGDPVFNPDELKGPKAQRAATRTAVKTRAYTDFWQGAGIDHDKLSKALPRLEDTADELKAVAKKLGAPTSDIHLRAAASEKTVRSVTLANYRIVYFATHGLVAGDIKGLAEPSLALSIPAQPTTDDDGLLTASEIAQLKLNADWVVLSACNTIAGDRPGAEALSGLARAFFYAGARALLVSHWAVESNAATLLTTSTFDLLKSDPKLGRAEALRRAMLAYMNDASNPRNAYPAYWAPFVVVGEGAAK
jgi:CHAT domain-containing protein/tetratricopeptide (TPR) repeat protein